MGNWLSSMFSGLVGMGKKDMRILMVGLDSAGKTSILYKLKLGEVVKTIPTIGFNVESIQYKNIDFTVWDVGGQDKIRPLWRYYYEDTHGIIFVVDSNDTNRFPEARDELHRMLEDPILSKAVLLVLANKEDLPNAVPTHVIVNELGLPQLKTHPWFIISCCAVNGNGLYEGFDWLSEKLQSVSPLRHHK